MLFIISKIHFYVPHGRLCFRDVRPSCFEWYHFLLTVSYGKVHLTPLVMVPAVSWNDVVVHAALNFDLDIYPRSQSHLVALLANVFAKIVF
jgi:hypothetical protein